ncbi:DUF4249 domain-containing protein [Psychroserpens jangbogonensis]|uniref:DUF4249 domain-containing protein n=1 Tax=Psychroserpens jangbogonensis TaxID=1484460 RepID=UPI00053EE6CE|nr:DUF4249 domain-containing protein [Psychroserpens jangbogonensis]
MTTISRIIIVVILASIIFTSCTDVIDVDVPEAESRLVIEASIDWEKGTSGSDQTIKLSKSTPYFEQQSVPATGASVKVTNANDGTFFIFDDQNNGAYTTNSFIPELNQSYTLEIIYIGETYTATETLTPVVDIEDIYQSMDKGISDVLEINVDFQDPANEENFYFFKIQEQADALPTLFDIKDEFVDGNLINIFNERDEDEDINQEEYQPGDSVDIEFHGISEQYFEYISLLIIQFEATDNPFGTIPVPLKGNCINESNRNKDAFGYFRLTEVVKSTYIFQ